MRNVSYVGLCWVMTLGLVAVALGQQQWPAPGQGTSQNYNTVPLSPPAPQGQPARGFSQRNGLSQQLGMPAPGMPQNRSLITGTNRQAQPGMNEGERRGVLGVWMGETGGPGVRILRLTQGSAAEQAGLRVGDVILQVSGRGATSPQVAAQMIRQIPIGQSGKLTIWRDGDQQQLQFTMQPTREMVGDVDSGAPHQVGFGAADMSTGDLASRTMRLEQQINSLTQELTTLRQELAQLQHAGPVQTGFNAEANQGGPPQEPPARSNETLKPAAPAAAPAPAKPTAPPAEPAKPAAAPAAPQAPATEKASNDLFGSDSAPAKSQEKPKTEEKPKADDKAGADDLFK